MWLFRLYWLEFKFRIWYPFVGVIVVVWKVLLQEIRRRPSRPL